MTLIRHISLALLFIFSAWNSLSANDARLSTCYKSAKKFYSQNAQQSDTQRGFEAAYVLAPLLSLRGIQNEELGISFNEEKLIYRGTGSMHSGYFIDLVVVNPEDCKAIQIINVYSE